jgi:hypothetical protein
MIQRRLGDLKRLLLFYAILGLLARAKEAILGSLVGSNELK